MPGTIDELAVVLEEELALTHRLLDLAKDARAAAIAVDPETLVQIVAEQEECAARLETAEARRLEAAGAAGRELGLELREPVRLKAIAERADGTQAARLRSLGSRLKLCSADLREISARNRQLLESSLAHVDEFFVLLAETRQKPAAYGAGGSPRPMAGAALMDRKA
jgi:flagellar biosynthesis/type III secretory pathway chaperone